PAAPQARAAGADPHRARRGLPARGRAMNAPIRVRITAWYVALLACILLAVGGFVLLRLRADLIDATDRALRPALVQIALGYRNEGFPEFRDQSATVLAQERAASQVLTADGTVVRALG